MNNFHIDPIACIDNLKPYLTNEQYNFIVYHMKSSITPGTLTNNATILITQTIGMAVAFILENQGLKPVVKSEPVLSESANNLIKAIETNFTQELLRDYK